MRRNAATYIGNIQETHFGDEYVDYVQSLREFMLGCLWIYGQGVMIVTYTYLLTVLVKTASVSSAPWRKKPVNSSVNLPVFTSINKLLYVFTLQLNVMV